MPNNQSLGREGEKWVAALLIAKGWRLEARNWRRPGLELDLILRRDRQLLVVEVKTRCYRGADWDPCQVFSWKKRQSLARGVQFFLSSLMDSEELTISVYLAIVFKRAEGLQVNWYPLDIEM